MTAPYEEIQNHIVKENLNDWLQGRKINKETRELFEAVRHPPLALKISVNSS